MGMGIAAALLSGLAVTAIVAGPASAAGDTSRYKGCAAHWRNTATWNECSNSPGVNLQLQSRCKRSADFGGTWRFVQGTLTPIDRWECAFEAIEAFNVYGN
jgi:hypothetical protein